MKTLLALAAAIIGCQLAYGQSVAGISQPPEAVFVDPAGQCSPGQPEQLNIATSPPRNWVCGADRAWHNIAIGASTGAQSTYTLCPSGCNSTIPSNTVTVAQTTHLQGVNPLIIAYDGSSPAKQISIGIQAGTNPGDVILTYGVTLSRVEIIGGISAYTLCPSGCASTIPASTVTIPETTHLQGVNPLVIAWDSSTPSKITNVGIQAGTNPGDLTLTYGITLSRIEILGFGGTFTPPPGTQTQYLRIQPNTGNNTTYQFASLPFANMADYAFSPFQPGGTLTASTPATITIQCPLGVNGTDTAHYYELAGVGTPEAVLGTGGTCVSGGTGTLTFTPANNHGAGWTLGPTNGGASEAISAGALTLYGSAGITNVYAPAYVNHQITFVGLGAACSANGTTFVLPQDSGEVFNVNTNEAVNFSNACYTTTVTTPTSATGIVISAPSGANFASRIFNNQFAQLAIGVDYLNASGVAFFHNEVLGTTVEGIELQSIHASDTGGSIVEANEFSQTRTPLTTGNDAILITSGGAIRVSHNDIFGYGHAVHLNATVGGGSSELIIDANHMDVAGTSEVQLDGTEPYPYIHIVDNRCANYSYTLYSNPWTCIASTSSDVESGVMTDNVISGGSPSGVCGTQVGISIDSSNWLVANNYFETLTTGISVTGVGNNTIGLNNFNQVAAPWSITGSAALSTLPAPVPYSELGSAANGSVVMCSNCTVAACATSGTGALAVHVSGSWVCK